LPVELRNEINALLMDTGQSRRDFMAIALKKQVADYEIARMQGYNEGFAIGYKKGHDEGYKKGKQDWGIHFPCYMCGKLVYISTNSDCQKAVIEFLRERRWSHTNCNEQ